MLLPMSAIQDFPSYTTRVNRTAFECAIDGKSYCRIFVKDGDQIAAIRLDESESPTAPQDVHIGDKAKNNRPRIRVIPRARPPDNVAPVMVPTPREHRGESEAPPAKRSKKECHDEDKALPGTRSKAPSACTSSTRPRRPAINQAYVLLPFFLKGN